MIGQPRFHRGRHSQRLVDTAKIVICMADRNHVAGVLGIVGYFESDEATHHFLAAIIDQTPSSKPKGHAP
jgi:hypothetical protein